MLNTSRRDPFVAPSPPRLGFGAWSVGGRGWGEPSTETERIATVRRALELGITFFDTAPTYGRSEALLGRALARERDDVFLATKLGPKDDPRTSIERSLRALGTDHIDVLQLHQVGDRFERSLERMNELREEGRVGAIGVCNATPAQMHRALELAPIQSVQLPYNLFDRDAERRMLPFCRDRGLAFLAYRPLASGLLSGRLASEEAGAPSFYEGDHRRHIYWFRGHELRRRRRVLRKLGHICERLGTTIPALALGWVLAREGVSTALAGARTAAQVEENAEGSSIGLSSAEVEEIDAAVADAFRPPRATDRTREFAAAWDDRERFIVERLDGRTRYEQIADQWLLTDPSTPLSTAQVRTFADQLVDRGVAVPETSTMDRPLELAARQHTGRAAASAAGSDMPAIPKVLEGLDGLGATRLSAGS